MHNASTALLGFDRHNEFLAAVRVLVASNSTATCSEHKASPTGITDLPDLLLVVLGGLFVGGCAILLFFMTTFVLHKVFPNLVDPWNLCCY